MIITKIENVYKKKEIMYSKNKLKGERIYIEHELAWEERKRQEIIGKWAIEEKTNDRDIKFGFGRVKINGV